MNDGNCGCCTTTPAAVPAEISNRPGLSAVAYRIGTFGTFRKAITDALSHTPELTALGARGSDDYTITAIELWSAVADVLTFYQERAANEAFLRTATLRDSMLRLVRLIGYELAPGAAATAKLAFTLEANARALIPARTRVKSVPAEGEKAQTYETLADLPADGRLNRLRLFPWPTTDSPTGVGTAEAISAPDPDAIATLATLAAGERVMLYAPNAFEMLTVGDVRVVDDMLLVRWSMPIGGTVFVLAWNGANPAVRAYKLGRSFHLFGFDAPPVVTVSALATPGDATTAYLLQANMDYSLHGDGTAVGGAQLSLDSRYDGLQPGSIQRPGTILLAVATLGTTVTAIPFAVTAVSEKKVDRKPSGVSTAALSGTVAQVTLASLVTGKVVDDLIAASGGDVRNIVVYELKGDPLRFWGYEFADVVASREVYLPGRRSGWSSAVVGQTIEKGAYKGGMTLSLTDIAPGRDVLVTDASGAAPITATITGVSLMGSAVSFAPTESDVHSVSTLGLAADQTTPITAIVSRSHDGPISFASPARLELTVKIGSLPMLTVALNAAAVGAGAVTSVASALQNALRAALPGAPTFALAQAVVISNAAGDAIAVTPGVPGDEVAFGPTPNDPHTVSDIGLEAGVARFLDGVVSARIGPLATGAGFGGNVRVAVGNLPPVDLVGLFIYTNATSLAVMMIADFGVNAFVTDDDRVLALPPLPVREPRAFVRLQLEPDSPLALSTSSAVLLGNVAPASHGETVRNEILGDGDASQAFQTFPLKKKPVTYVPDDVAGGASSSLQVLVNGVLWDEVPTLFGRKQLDQVYISRIADDGTLSVRFGDGTMGARPDTGRQNIVAMYRQGTGLAGRVAAGKLSTLVDRPTGVRSVTNLLATDGGADPETLAHAREAAPGTVRTFGRAVSLRDFEDTTLMAGEVAKAMATWVWTGERRAIHLTVAAQAGALFSADGLARLMATLTSERDPNHKLLIGNYTAVAVRVSASLTVDPRHVNDEVLAAARAALLDALSFERRRFADPVYLSDVIAVLQNVAGVVAVDVDLLDLKSTDPGFRAQHGVDDTLPQPQARLLMLPARPGGTPGAVLPAEIALVEVPAQDLTLTAVGGLVL